MTRGFRAEVIVRAGLAGTCFLARRDTKASGTREKKQRATGWREHVAERLVDIPGQRFQWLGSNSLSLPVHASWLSSDRSAPFAMVSVSISIRGRTGLGGTASAAREKYCVGAPMKNVSVPAEWDHEAEPFTGEYSHTSIGACLTIS